MDPEEEKARREVEAKVQKLRDSKFKQQKLPAWRPTPSYKSTMITFTIFGIVFLGLGILLSVMSDQIREEVLQSYDDKEPCKSNLFKNCTLTLTIKEKIIAPVFVYYQLDNFYQNHRRYVKSRSFKQLQGNYLPVDQLADCDPIKTNKDLRPQINKYAGETTNFTPADELLPAVPCGLVAKSFFNDKYYFRKQGDTDFATINDTGIAWESDLKYKFANVPDTKVNNVTKSWDKIQWIDMKNGKLDNIFAKYLQSISSCG